MHTDIQLILQYSIGMPLNPPKPEEIAVVTAGTSHSDIHIK
jgi:hypothetical protein